MADLQDINLKLKLKKELRGTFKNRFAKDLFKAISPQFGKGGGYPSKSKKVRSQSGDLLNSFKRGDENNIYKVNFTDTDIDIEWGSKLPYAQIQENGGQIQATEKMEGFFWYKFYSTKDDYFKNIALRVKSGKPLNIKAKHYQRDGWKTFEKTYLPKLVDDLTKNIME